jgi:hypothetical protein
MHRRLSVKSASHSAVLLAIAGVFACAVHQAKATQIFVSTFTPRSAGVVPFHACSDTIIFGVGGNLCFGHFFREGLSDFLDVTVPGEPTQEASLSESGPGTAGGVDNFGPPLVGNEATGDFYNIRVPGFTWDNPHQFWIRDGNESLSFASDIVSYVNFSNGAAILWGSFLTDPPSGSNSDELSLDGLPPELAELALSSGAPVTVVDSSDGNVDSSADNLLLPNLVVCDTTACTTNLPPLLESIPEPPTLAIILTGFIGIAFVHRRKTRNSVYSRKLSHMRWWSI